MEEGEIKIIYDEDYLIPKIEVIKDYPQSKLPAKAHNGDLGYDLYALGQVTLSPDQSKLISTGIRIKFPVGWGGFIKERSSVSLNHKVFVHAGVIDNGYRGEIKVLMHNASDSFWTIYAGDKIAQMVLIPTVNFIVKEVKQFEDETSRGDGGFGSTN